MTIDWKTERILTIHTGTGREHDLGLFRRSGLKFSKKTCLLCDLGYVGIKEHHANTLIPYKKSKNRNLTRKERMNNRHLSRKRVRIEHVFARMKTFKILSERYRLSAERYDLHVNLIAALINFDRFN